MDWIIYIVSAVFALLAVALLFTWWRGRHAGALLMALNYVAAAGTALYMNQWWPLVIGFLSAWALRLMGLEPGAAPNAKAPRQES
jgi:hypothetical protein